MRMQVVQRLSFWVLACAMCAVISCATRSPVTLQRFEFEQPQMGVPFRMVLYAPDAQTAGEASDAAFNRVAELNAILSDYDYDSELSQLSRTSGTGAVVPLSEDLWKVLVRAQAIAEASDGVFDVTVGPAVNLWRKARRDKAFPDAKRLSSAREAVGYRHLVLDPTQPSALLQVPNMRLDLGGIAKGYALDEAMKVLKAKGIRSALVSGGGDIVVSEPPPGREGWSVELPVEGAKKAKSQFLTLKNESMATSGDLFQYVELDGKRYSHIVDPRTGVGLVNQSRVVVIAEDGISADALSTMTSVLGMKGVPLARKLGARRIYIAEGILQMP